MDHTADPYADPTEGADDDRPDTTPRPVLPTFEPIDAQLRDRAFQLVRDTSGVWRTHPLGGWFTNVEVGDRALYLRIGAGGNTGAVGDARAPHGLRVEVLLTLWQAAQLKGLAG